MISWESRSQGSQWEGRSIASFVSSLISWFSELQGISAIRNFAEGLTELTLGEREIWWLWKWAEDVRCLKEARSARRAHGWGAVPGMWRKLESHCKPEGGGTGVGLAEETVVVEDE